MNRCSSCRGGLKPAVINRRSGTLTVALAGNPNTGKSTIFNALTGLRQHTGNWPGKTVAKAQGSFTYKDEGFLLVDLPGTYSLLSASEDEEIARDFILFGQPECTVVVVDSTALERNLNLVLQVLEITDRVVVCVNLVDEAERKGIKINHRTLSKDLGVPVVMTSARKGEGIKDLLETVYDVCTGKIETSPRRVSGSLRFNEALSRLEPQIKNLLPGIKNARWIALRLLDGDHRVREALIKGKLGSVNGG